MSEKNPDLLAIIEKVVPLQDALEDLSISPTCPECRSNITIYKHGFVCHNSCCTLHAGNLFDFEVVPEDYIKAAYGHAPILQNLDWKLLYSQNTCRRLVQAFFRDMQLDGQYDNIQQAAFDRWLESRLIIPENAFGRIFFLTAKELEFLLDLLILQGYEVPKYIDISSPAAALVHYGNHHSIASISFISPKNTDWGTIVLRPFRHSFLGLSYTKPPYEFTCGSHVALSEGVMDCKFTASNSHTCAPELFSKGLHFLPQEQTLPPIRPVGDLASRCPLWAESQTWYEFVLNEVTKALQKEISFDRIVTFINHAKLSPEDQAQLAIDIEATGDIDDSRRIQEACLSVIVRLDEHWKLVRGPFSYMAGRPNQEVMTTVTNFAWEPDSIIIFDDRPPWLSGQFQNRELVRDLKIEAADLDSPGKVEERFRKQLPEGQLVQIFDRSLFAPLLDTWRRSTTTLPKKIGFAHLGWNPRYSKFYLPGVIVSQDGVRQCETPVWHPNSPNLHTLYRADVKTPIGEPEPETQLLMMAAAGNVVRSRRAQKPIVCRFPKASLPFLQQWFTKGFGQVDPIDPPPQSRDIYSQEFRGSPVWTSSYKKSLESGLGWAAWTAGEEDTPNMSVSAQKDAGLWLQHATIMAAKLCMSGAQPPILSVDHTHAMLAEGARILQMRLEQTSAYEALDAFFDGVAPEALDQHVALLYGKGLIEFRCKDPTNFALQFCTYYRKNCTTIEEDKVIVPENFGSDLCQKFYSYLPKLGIQM